MLPSTDLVPVLLSQAASCGGQNTANVLFQRTMEFKARAYRELYGTSEGLEDPCHLYSDHWLVCRQKGEALFPLSGFEIHFPDRFQERPFLPLQIARNSGNPQHIRYLERCLSDHFAGIRPLRFWANYATDPELDRRSALLVRQAFTRNVVEAFRSDGPSLKLNYFTETSGSQKFFHYLGFAEEPNVDPELIPHPAYKTQLGLMFFPSLGPQALVDAAQWEEYWSRFLFFGPNQNQL